MDKLTLLLAIHCHQPVGNFANVFSRAYEVAYLPFIEVLEQHPNIKISLHYSGSLLDWLKLNHPEFIKRIRNLAKKHQVEFLAGGYYEPVLSLIPLSDAEAQIEMLRNQVKELFDFQADGCWLTERVWEPKMPFILDRAGIRWTIVDDSHFKSAGLNPEDLSGFYISEEEARPLMIFPASEKLRYFMPFKLPHQTVKYLKNLYETQKVNCVCFADDGEKFGLWPGTNKWVYAEKWLENFLTALEENSSWLQIRSFSEYLNEHSPTARIYLNCASYREMLEWSGGYFRNFLLKYEEANWMHKRMLYVSQKLNKLAGQRSKDTQLTEARSHLYKAQTNDAYWHGVFGGLYLNHLRSSVYLHLIEAEKLIKDSKGNKLDMLDLDYDGTSEIILSSKYLTCYFSPHRGGALLELDYKPKSINLINTLMRRKEAYHEKLKEKVQKLREATDTPLSIHNLKKVKDTGLENFLFYDFFGRHCCLEHFLNKQTNIEQFLRCDYEELGDFIQGRYALVAKNKTKFKIGFELTREGKVKNQPVKITKRISLNNNDLVLNYAIKNESCTYLDKLFGIEFNLSVYDNNLSSSCGELKDAEGTSSSRSKIPEGVFKVEDVWNKITLEFTPSSPASVWHFPVETISDSETGIEKTYQELCLLFIWPLDIAPHRGWSVNLGLEIQ